MISIRLGSTQPGAGDLSGAVLAFPVAAAGAGEPALVLPDGTAAELAAELAAFVVDSGHAGAAGSVEVLPRPLRTPGKALLLGIGAGTENDWRAAGAALVRTVTKEPELSVHIPAGGAVAAVRGLAEGAWLAGYRFRLAGEADAPKLREITLLVEREPGTELIQALRTARVVAARTAFARDLTNTPSDIKTPAWFVEQVRREAGDALTVTVREPDALARDGFGGIIAVGAGSVHGPRLLELSWQPEGAGTHVVLVGKGITYDTGGIDIKPVEGMQLMRKDMGGAAAVLAATLAVAELGLPVRVTALAPLAENMLSGAAWRPGDVVKHYGGLTSEIHSTDAEGRVVVADALAYAVEQLAPDVLVDLATLTGASRVALGARIAALFTENDDLLKEFTVAAQQAGEQVWQLPLPDEYVKDVAAEIADLNNAPNPGVAGTLTAALYLREFTGDCRDNWVHLDMSSPAWSARSEGELAKGATGWGVRTLVRWLQNR